MTNEPLFLQEVNLQMQFQYWLAIANQYIFMSGRNDGFDYIINDALERCRVAQCEYEKLRAKL